MHQVSGYYITTIHICMPHATCYTYHIADLYCGLWEEILFSFKQLKYDDDDLSLKQSKNSFRNGCISSTFEIK